MSAYGITTADLVVRLSARTLAAVTDDVSGRVIDEALVAEKIADAEATFHSYAAVYYVTPVALPDENVRIAKRIVVDLAAWELLSRRPHAVAGDVGEIERTRYDAVMSWLRSLSARDRRVQLVGSPERVITSPPSGGAAVVSEAPQFPPEILALF